MPDLAEILIGPAIAYPTPWRCAEMRGDKQVVVCAEGHWVFECPNPTLAELIVQIVNVYGERIHGACIDEASAQVPATRQPVLPLPPTTPKMLRELANVAETHLRPQYPHASPPRHVQWIRDVADLMEAKL